MRIPLARGRYFEESDRAGAPEVAIVNQQFARQYLDRQEAIGTRIRIFGSDNPAVEIVGVVDDVREQGLTGPPVAVVFVPVSQVPDATLQIAHSYFQANWIVRARPGAGPLAPRLQEVVRAIDPQQPFSAFRSMDDVVASAVAPQRFQMTLLSVFAGLALVLAVAGIYGVTAYSVAQRVREIGIRMALGATARQMLRSIVGQAVRLAVVGVVAGIALSYWTARLLDSLVFGVSTLDVPTFGLVAVSLVGVAAAAALVPAIRAARLDPVRALRQE
jgi:predicted permease